MHIERPDVVGVRPGDVGALVVNGQRPTLLPRGKAKRKLLADFTVGEGDNVGGIGVDTAECHDLDVEAGFFLTSRMAVCSMVSPMSWPPPGSAQSSLSRRFISRMRPSSSVTIADADGTTLLGLGASGSL